MPEARRGDATIKTAEDPQICTEKGKGTTAGQREKWANKTEFLLSMAGEIIGLGNVWRFPYLCYKNGGGVFFIPYFVFLIFCGIPVFFLETALGQYTSEGGITAWRKICPMFEGIGIASQVIVIYLNIYYIVVLAWAVFYLFSCFQTTLPWISCANEWNTGFCHVYNQSSGLHRADADWSFLYNETHNDSMFSLSEPYKVVSPEEEFWLYRVQRVSSDDFLGAPHYDLTFCLLLVWIICYFCIWKGVKTTGKVVYFTATFPYVMLLILFFRGITLPGAGQGISYYLYPDVSKLAHADVWLDAGTQVFFSYAVCQGVLTALGSYNKYHNDCYKDCITLCALNSGTSIFAGFAVFSILGYMSYELSVPMNDIVSSGPGLAFIAYPKALSLLPGPQFWSVLFFLMVLFLGLDSQFVCVESLATALTDVFPGILRKPKRREILVLLIAVVCFLLGLPLVTPGGLHLFKLIDMYGPSGTNLLFIAIFETVIIAWVYGVDRFFDNIEDMIGYHPIYVLKYCWLFITPLICGITLLYDLISSPPLSAVTDFIPRWGSAVAALLTLTPMICIPIFIVVAASRGRDMTSPSADLQQRNPNKPRLTLCEYVITEGEKLSYTEGEKSVEEKALKEDTTDM
ncbi:sodium- and chloride-dependent GABA transporter 2-like [Neoarius graeffei]|uniref:sodium- and chloride-dependent GABA transporter 2-like n=1 Tax=Neoarius graeffei TaxID=443677 RepID=UPI00298D3B8F|nr:sodium- and chloride-dependent GABA transporter 2-like [Neoarius graeffei]XP_060759014.1 sodium- and chloride-dependent GABA transporter 2-like [Neoarius graeffei]